MRWISIAFALACAPFAVAQGPGNPTTAEAWGGELLTNSGQDEHFGNEVSISGDYAYVGAARYDALPLTDTGALYVFQRPTPPSSVWTQVAMLQPPVSNASEEYGRYVAVDGSTLAVATIHFLLAQTGRVYVYEGGGSAWTYRGTLIGPPLQNGDVFGLTDVSGSRIIVGAPGTSSYQGAAYLFTRTGPDWTTYSWQSLVPTIGPPTAGDMYGHDIAIDGDIAVVGATGPSVGGSNGAVYVFEYDSGAGVWINVQKLSISSSGPGTDAFGFGLEIDDATFIVGAYQRDVVGVAGTEVDAGEAYVFTRTGGAMGAGTWALQATLQRPVADVQAYEQFGFAIDVEGDRAVVGSRNDGASVGAAYVYGRSGTTWTLNAVKALPTHDSGSIGGTADGFGTSLVLDGKHNELIVGAPTHDHSTTLVMSGAAFVYALTAPPETYCTAKLSSQACLPSIGFSGSSNASASTVVPFNITCSQVIPNKFGIFFYGVSGPFAAPFQGGHLCVKPPIGRTSPQSSGGSGPCTGSYTFDLNALIQSGAAPELYPGVRVCSQYWYRDPPSSFTIGLSDALDLVIAP